MEEEECGKDIEDRTEREGKKGVMSEREEERKVVLVFAGQRKVNVANATGSDSSLLLFFSQFFKKYKVPLEEALHSGDPIVSAVEIQSLFGNIEELRNFR